MGVSRPAPDGRSCAIVARLRFHAVNRVPSLPLEEGFLPMHARAIIDAPSWPAGENVTRQSTDAVARNAIEPTKGEDFARVYSFGRPSFGQLRSEGVEAAPGPLTVSRRPLESKSENIKPSPFAP